VHQLINKSDKVLLFKWDVFIKHFCMFVARHEFVSVKEVFLLALSAGVEVCDVIKNAVAVILKLQLL